MGYTKEIKIFSLSLLCGLALIGCGSSSSTDSGTTTAYAIGSIYENATCCFDTDTDDSCIGEATRVLSSSDGSFILNSTAQNTILCELNGAIKHLVEGDAGENITSDKKLRAPVGADDGSGTYIVSALTTKIWDEMEQDSSLTVATAKTKVSNQLGISVDDLTKNFHNDSTISSEVKTKMQNESDNIFTLMDNNGSMSSVRTYVGTMNLPEQIDPLAE